MAVVTELIVPRRFRGPSGSGNGGWSAGSLAAHVDPEATARGVRWPPIEVTLRRPPPLELPLTVSRAEDAVRLVEPDGQLVAAARVAEKATEPVPSVPPATARAAEPSYAGHRTHPFPGCFVCGPERAPGDGLRIFPGPVDAPGQIAATWTPTADLDEGPDPEDEPRVGLAVTWAALDCPGGWAGDLTDRMMVLGRITARVDVLPVVGEPHVVVGAHRGSEGRKTFTASTLYDADGRVVAVAEHVWIAIEPGSFG
ncbi:hypothetical protein [Nocardioides campestrisoli]|uniref:hypothetical protein n=1 Tax=Nocardioides campestrisoli TaxID=2736757 RepID=UPI0015E6444D|nr:hypothetical protein [Nocardioides campestrisoli]